MGFIKLQGKDAAPLETAIINQLEADGINFADCRSQCYDNASVMSGHSSGLQKRMLDRNPLALFINCDNHSLNLVGVNAVSAEAELVTFFGIFQSLFAFFSRSTTRWVEMKTSLPVTVKRECDTRWSVRFDAVKCANDGIVELADLLERLSDDENATADTKSRARNLLSNILTFNFLTFLPFWFKILEQVNRTQKRLQDPKMNFHEASKDIHALQLKLEENRDALIKNSVTIGKERCAEWDVETDLRRRRRKKMPGEHDEDVGLSKEDELRRILNGVFDYFSTDLRERFTRLATLNEKFGFLLDVDYLVSNKNPQMFKEKCEILAIFYDTDINGDELFRDINDCVMLLKTRDDIKIDDPADLLLFIITYGEDVFPNLRVSLQILLTIAVSIASCERSFNKLKLMLSSLRVSMGQDRLNDLALLSIERKIFEEIDFSDVIDEFASRKARKVAL